MTWRSRYGALAYERARWEVRRDLADGARHAQEVDRETAARAIPDRPARRRRPW